MTPLRIVYIGRHGQVGSSNDDEGAVAYALRQLGHEVVCVPEQPARKVFDGPPADLCLFNKWSDWEAIRQIQCPKVFWYWDLVDYPKDPSLARRCAQRRSWMQQATAIADLGFCTDGDWVAKDTTGKLHWLMQGFDERLQPAERTTEDIDILLPCSVIKCGEGRARFVAAMKERWGPRVHHVEGGVHGKRLAELVARSKVVVCPDEPHGARYWSNRLYLMSGLGGVIVHPLCVGFWPMSPDALFAVQGVSYYIPGSNIRDDIAHLLEYHDARIEGGQIARKDVLAHHLYRHRCEQLIQTVRDRLKI